MSAIDLQFARRILGMDASKKIWKPVAFQRPLLPIEMPDVLQLGPVEFSTPGLTGTPLRVELRGKDGAPAPV